MDIINKLFKCLLYCVMTYNDNIYHEKLKQCGKWFLIQNVRNTKYLRHCVACCESLVYPAVFSNDL